MSDPNGFVPTSEPPLIEQILGIAPTRLAILGVALVAVLVGSIMKAIARPAEGKSGPLGGIGTIIAAVGTVVFVYTLCCGGSIL